MFQWLLDKFICTSTKQCFLLKWTTGTFLYFKTKLSPIFSIKVCIATQVYTVYVLGIINKEKRKEQWQKQQTTLLPIRMICIRLIKLFLGKIIMNKSWKKVTDCHLWVSKTSVVKLIYFVFVTRTSWSVTMTSNKPTCHHLSLHVKLESSDVLHMNRYYKLIAINI